MVVVTPKVGEIEDLELWVWAYCWSHFEEWHAEFVFDSKDGEYYRKYEKESLYEVGPYNGFDATFDGICPDKKDGYNCIECKWEPERLEYGDLQNKSYDKEAKTCSY